MNRKTFKQTRAALRAAAALIGPDTVPPLAPAALAAAAPPLPPEPPVGPPRPPATRGRPRGGMREEARQQGVASSTFRRRVLVARLREHPAVAEAINAAPVELSAAACLRIVRCSTEAAMLAALEAEVASRIAPKPPSPADRLQQRVADLEAEVAALKAEVAALRAHGPAPAAAMTVEQISDLPRNARLAALQEISAVNMLRHLAADKQTRTLPAEEKPMPVGHALREMMKAMGVKTEAA
jgi:hypothetical protein